MPMISAGATWAASAPTTPPLTGRQIRDVADPDRIEASLITSPLGMVREASSSRILDCRHRSEHARTDALQPLTTHGRSDRLPVDHHAFGGELAGDPGCPVDIVGGLELLAHGLVDHLSALSPRPGAVPATALPGVVALPSHAQKPCHAGDLEIRFLRVHQLEPFRRGGFDAKKAAAFPRNSLSRSRSWTRRRSCLSSSRSSAPRGASGL